MCSIVGWQRNLKMRYAIVLHPGYASDCISHAPMVTIFLRSLNLRSETTTG